MIPILIIYCRDNVLDPQILHLRFCIDPYTYV